MKDKKKIGTQMIQSRDLSSGKLKIDCFHENINLETVLEYTDDVRKKYPDYDFCVALTIHYDKVQHVSDIFPVDDTLKRELKASFRVFDDVGEIEYPVKYTLIYFCGTKRLKPDNFLEDITLDMGLKYAEYLTQKYPFLLSDDSTHPVSSTLRRIKNIKENDIKE